MSNPVKFRHFFGIIVATAVALLITENYHVRADSVNPGVFSIESSPYGTDYSEWTAKWWQWFISIPPEEHPATDPTGIKCSAMQDDPNVWFLAQPSSGSDEFDCSVPEGMAIFVPVMTGECDFMSDPSIQTESELSDCAASGIEGVLMQVSIDGTEVKEIESYRIQSPLFDFIVPENNIFGPGPTGTTQAVADGYYLFLEPLSPGKHEIQVSASIVDNPSLGTYSWAVERKYSLTIAQADSESIIEPQTISVGSNETSLPINSTSGISGFAFDEEQAMISFNVTGQNGTEGSAIIPIGQLLKGPYIVTVDGETVVDFETINDGNTTAIRIDYVHQDPSSIIAISGTQVVPEFSLTVVMLAAALGSVVVIFVRKRKIS